MSKEKLLVRSRLEIDGVFDIETANWSEFVVGGLMMSDGSYFCRQWEDEDALVHRIISQEGTIWGFNCGRFDSLWLLKNILGKRTDKYCVPHFQGSRIVCLRVGKNLLIRDASGLAPFMKLRKFAEFCNDSNDMKDSLGLRCVCQKGCEGYCAISRDMSQIDMDILKGYLKKDCLSLLEGLRGLQAYADAHDLDLRGTIGSSAWATAQRWGKIPDAKWKSSHYNFARGGYYGGRTQVFQPCPKKPMIYRYDINSCYPSALSDLSLPIGSPEFVFGKKAQRAFDEQKEGIYDADVYVPRQNIPPLPIRAKFRVNAKYRYCTAYPVLGFRGRWTRLELAYAVEKCGVKIERMRKALVYGETRKVLSPFMRAIWGMRSEELNALMAKGQTGEEAKKSVRCVWTKAYGNSLSGKVAQHPDTIQVKINPIIDEDFQIGCKPTYNCYSGRLCNGKRPPRCCSHKCVNRCGGWRAIDIDQRVWQSHRWRIAECSHVHWAAYLTSYARVKLHQQLISDGQNGASAVYCDTDSVMATSPRDHDIGTDLGQWMFEGIAFAFQSLAPKVYRFRYQDQKTKEIKWKVRAKGIPDVDKLWSELAAGMEITIEKGVNMFKSALRTADIFSRRKLTRTSRANGQDFGDRILRNGLTEPRDMTSLEYADR